MNDKINMNMIIYKAQVFGMNPKLISHLINSKLEINKEMKQNLIHIIDAISDVEKSSQLSLQ